MTVVSTKKIHVLGNINACREYRRGEPCRWRSEGRYASPQKPAKWWAGADVIKVINPEAVHKRIQGGGGKVAKKGKGGKKDY